MNHYILIAQGIGTGLVFMSPDQETESEGVQLL